MNVNYDCGLASTYLYLATQSPAMARIFIWAVYQVPAKTVVMSYKPDGHNAVMMMLIGNVPDDVDAVSSATQRDPLDEMVTYIE